MHNFSNIYLPKLSTLAHKMATPDDPSSLKVYVEAVQTVMPAIPTDPRKSRQVSIKKDINSSIFQRRFHTILYYKKASDEDSGWLLAGWTKESLAAALSDQPILAGRLRRVEDGDGRLEIVPNDSGVRLIEARIPINLEKFLNLRNKEGEESRLVFWESIDEHDPQFSPLHYVQVTNFKCGGYSIGISCSLLLADPLVMTSFIKTWANIHVKIVTKFETPKLPIFYLPNLGKTSSAPSYPNHPGPTQNIGQTFIFKITQINLIIENIDMQKAVAKLCIEEAKRRLGRKIASNFYLIMKESSNDIIKVEICEKQESLNIIGVTNEIINWDEYLGADGLSFTKGNKPAACASYWINSPFDEEGFVMIIPSPDVGMSVIVTIPSDNSLI